MIIGLTGFKGAGKDTAADALDGWYRYSFAEPMRRGVSAMFDIPKSLFEHPWKDREVERLGMTPRELLRNIGQEGRKWERNPWIAMAQHEYDNMPEEFKGMVVTDVRMHDEALWIKSNGGIIIEIVRPGVKSDGHETEQRLWDEFIDYTLVNNSTPEHLHRRVAYFGRKYQREN